MAVEELQRGLREFFTSLLGRRGRTAYPLPMPVLDPLGFAAALPDRGGLIGLDPGSKRIGVAASDPDRRLASPVDVITRSKFSQDALHVWALYDQRKSVGLVIGLPLNMDGSSGPSAQAARAFARNLLALRDLPCLLWDERLTTAAVTRELIGLDMSRAKRSQRVDMHAAAYLLQGAIDRLREMSG